MTAYYNEIDPYAAQWLRNLIREGHIAPGEVDSRSIVDVRPDDLAGFDQCHFFAGIGGWSCALRIAGWADDRAVWTGSCPCQPFSQAGNLERFNDARHLWPVWAMLIDVRRPPIVFGEQVANAIDWLSLVRGDLETMDYAVGAIPMEAASAGAEEFGDRFWFVAASSIEDDRRTIHPKSQRPKPEFGSGFFEGDDRRGQGRVLGRLLPDASVPLLAHEIPARLDQYRAFGNSIDPIAAATFICAAMIGPALTSQEHSPTGE